MPTRPAVPAPRPLSPRAAAYVRQVNAAEAKRLHDVQNAVTKAVAAIAPVAKAPKAKTDQVAVYDADGNLVGVTDPEAITPLAPAKAPGTADAPPTDLTPAPSADAGTPAEDAEVTKARVQKMSSELKKALNGGVALTASEQARVADAMNAAALAKFQEMRRQGLAPGSPRRP